VVTEEQREWNRLLKEVYSLVKFMKRKSKDKIPPAQKRLFEILPRLFELKEKIIAESKKS